MSCRRIRESKDLARFRLFSDGQIVGRKTRFAAWSWRGRLHQQTIQPARTRCPHTGRSAPVRTAVDYNHHDSRFRIGQRLSHAYSSGESNRGDGHGVPSGWHFLASHPGKSLHATRYWTRYGERHPSSRRDRLMCTSVGCARKLKPARRSQISQDRPRRRL